MYDYLRALHQRFCREPDCAEQRREIEMTCEQLRSDENYCGSSMSRMKSGMSLRWKVLCQDSVWLGESPKNWKKPAFTPSTKKNRNE